MRRYSAARWVAAPSTPLSWCMHAPRKSSLRPLMRSPFRESTEIVLSPTRSRRS